MYGTQLQRSAIPAKVWRQVGLGALLLTLTVGLAACGDREAEEAAPADTAATAPGMTGAAQADTVEVTLSEYEIQMPEELPAGPTVFRVTNSGSEEHNFEVKQGEMEVGFEENLQPGETNTLQMDLEAGTYVVYCPVNNHGERGMTMNLTAGKQEGPAEGQQ